MKSLRQLYKIGSGPSSSHTMGPEFATRYFLSQIDDADSYKVILYGSLALTGKGHQTDVAILKNMAGHNCEVVFDTDTAAEDIPHVNTMEFIAYKNGEEVLRKRIFSVGGGDIRIEGEEASEYEEVYKESSLSEIIRLCNSRNIRLSDYVFENEDENLPQFLLEVWQTMKEAVYAGLTHTGTLPGGLNVQRVAQLLYNRRHIDETSETREHRIVCAYAFAVAEHNADCGTIVTAPTCGACAVVPAVMKYMQEKKSFTDDQIIRALAVGGLIGNLVKKNASISGAECGCQAEIGTATAMAAAALAELYEMGLDQIEYAAEMAMEHMLGLTCDPVCGLVQIPCIERNAVAAMRAINAVSMANFLTGTRKISFDMVVKTMYETGRDIDNRYRETSTGGLAKLDLF